MWNLIVSFNRKMKKYVLYRAASIVPRLFYRLLISIRKVCLHIWTGLSSWYASCRGVLLEKINEAVVKYNEFREEVKWKNLKAKEHERYFREGNRWFPMVSVIMPVYNAEAYLQEALNCLVQQTYPHFEVICVDDGSTDSSPELLEQMKRSDSRFRVYHQKNKYAGAARNLGMKKARGRYLLFLDADDTYDPHLIEQSVTCAYEQDVDVVLFGADYLHMTQGKHDRAKWQLLMHLVPEKQPFSWKDCPESLFQITLGVPWTKLFRHSFIRKTRLKFQHLYNSNDVFFCYSALAMAKRIAVVDEALVTYRMGQSTNLQSSTKRCFFEAYLALKQQLIKLGIYQELKQSFVNTALSSMLHNLSKVQDEQAQRLLYDKVKNQILAELDLCGHQKDYIYDQKKAELLSVIEHEDYQAYRNMLG